MIFSDKCTRISIAVFHDISGTLNFISGLRFYCKKLLYFHHPDVTIMPKHYFHMEQVVHQRCTTIWSISGFSFHRADLDSKSRKFMLLITILYNRKQEADGKIQTCRSDFFLLYFLHCNFSPGRKIFMTGNREY